MSLKYEPASEPLHMITRYFQQFKTTEVPETLTRERVFFIDNLLVRNS